MSNELAELGSLGRISYRLLGPERGLPLVLLRPLGGSMALWGTLEARLAEHYRLLVFDPRGVGASGPAPLGCSTRGMAADVRVLLQTLRIARANVFGLSLGGMVGEWLAIDAPELVNKLILASTLPRAGAISRRIAGDVLSFARWFLRPGIGAEVGLVRQILSPEFRRAQPERVAAIEALVRAHPTSRANLWKLALAAAGHDAEPRLSEIAAPTLLLVGARDPVAGSRSQTELILGIADARLEVIRESGHDLSLEAPDATYAHVRAFLDGEALARPAEGAIEFLSGH